MRFPVSSASLVPAVVSEQARVAEGHEVELRRAVADLPYRGAAEIVLEARMAHEPTDSLPPPAAMSSISRFRLPLSVWPWMS